MNVYLVYYLSDSIQDKLMMSKFIIAENRVDVESIIKGEVIEIFNCNEIVMNMPDLINEMELKIEERLRY